MKSDEDVRMISAEAPVLFAKVRADTVIRVVGDSYLKPMLLVVMWLETSPQFCVHTPIAELHWGTQALHAMQD